MGGKRALQGTTEVDLGLRVDYFPQFFDLLGQHKVANAQGILLSASTVAGRDDLPRFQRLCPVELVGLLPRLEGFGLSPSGLRGLFRSLRFLPRRFTRLESAEVGLVRLRWRAANATPGQTPAEDRHASHRAAQGGARSNRTYSSHDPHCAEWQTMADGSQTDLLPASLACSDLGSWPGWTALS